MLLIWSRKRKLYEGKVDHEDSLKYNITFYFQGLHVHYIKAMLSIFGNMVDYIDMCRVVLLNDAFS